MVEEKYLELIQADVDGELPASQRAELSRYLLANPEARAARDGLQRLAGLLGSVPAADPPADLKAAVLASARLPALQAGSGGGRGFRLPPTTMRYAAAVAGAVLVSALAFHIGLDRRSGVEVSEVVGTLADHQKSAGSAPTGTLTDTIAVSLDQVTGQVRLYAWPDRQVVEFDLQVRQPVDVVVSQDGREEGVGRFAPAAAGGRQRTVLVLDGAGQPGAPVQLRFVAGGTEIYRGTLEQTGGR